MLPVIQEQLLLVKVLQGLCQTLLCLSLGYLAGDVLLNLPKRAFSSAALLPPPPHDPSHPRLLTGRRAGLLIALILACNLLLMKIAYRTALFSGPVWGALTALFIVGLGLILATRQHLKGTRAAGPLPLAAALVGDLLLLSICFFLLNAESLLLRPESWSFLASRPSLLLSWHGTLRFAQFCLLALMLAAATQHRGRPLLVLAASLLWPPSQVLELLLTPQLAASFATYPAAALALAACALVAGSALRALRRKEPIALGWALTGIVLLAVLWVFGAQAAREQTLTETALAGLQSAAPTAPAPPRQAAPEVPAKPTPPPALDGPKLFEQKCTVCHRFDQRLVGPPLNDVLGKYRKSRDALVGFLRNPRKIDPAYPAMPNLNLAQGEADALAAYLLDRAAESAPR